MGRGSSGKSQIRPAQVILEEFQKKQRAYNIMNEQYKKADKIANSRAYYPDDVRHEAELNAEKYKIAMDVMSAQMEALEKEYTVSRAREEEKQNNRKVINFQSELRKRNRR